MPCELAVCRGRRARQPQDAAPAQPATDRIGRPLAHARVNTLADTLPIERLADAANLSARQVSRLFCGKTGATLSGRSNGCAPKSPGSDCPGLGPVEQASNAAALPIPSERRAVQHHHGQSPQLLGRIERAQQANVDCATFCPAAIEARGRLQSRRPATARDRRLIDNHTMIRYRVSLASQPAWRNP